jgi:hypothetical protein
MWLPSHRAPFVLWLSAFFCFGVTLFSLAGDGLFGLLGIRVILGVAVQEGFAA